MIIETFHEIWWIFSRGREPWAGLRIAHFRKTVQGDLFFIIEGEPPDRVGLRIWNDVAAREGWFKVQQIVIPTWKKIKAAREAAKMETGA